jgi:PAS domain S-box-containing protein
MIRFFPQRLFSQTILLICLILVVTNIIYSLFVGGHNARTALEQKKQHALVIVDNLVIYSAHRVVVGDYSGLELFLLQSAKLPDIKEIAVIDNEGVFLSHIIHIQNEEPKATYSPQTQYQDFASTNPIKFDKDKMVVTQPITAGKQLGVMKVVFSLDSIHALQHNIWRDTLIVGCISLIVTILILIIFLRIPIKAVRTLSDFARDLNKKEGEGISLNFPSLELKQLKESLNLASREIQSAKQQLDDEKELLDIILNSISDGVIATDTNQYVLFLNKAAEKMTGWKISEVIGKSFFSIFFLLHHQQQAKITNPADSAINQGSIFEYDEPLVLKSRNGADTDIICSAAPIINREKRIVGAVIVFRDISDKKKVEEEKESLLSQLRQAHKMEAIGTMAGGIAHDFNNILTPILGYSEMLQLSIPPEKPLYKYAKAIVNASRRAQSLVQQILAFSRLSEHELKSVQVDLIVEEAIKLLQSSIPSTIQFETDIEKQCGSVIGDPAKLHQIIMNLCTNAYHAMKDEGGVLSIILKKVKITSSDYPSELHLEPGKYICLEISDTGCGIPEEIKDRIFDPYFTTKLRGEGTGLGLSVVHGIVKLLKGHITFYSEPGVGTAFHVYLPRTSDGEGLNHLDQKNKELIGGNERLLIVDDENQVLEFEADALKSLGYEVHTFSNSKEALEAFKRKPDNYDLVITDMTMPYLTGSQLARKIVGVRPDIPIILCTGFSEMINEQKAKALGIRGYITKPIILSQFADMVRKSLDDRISISR